MINDNLLSLWRDGIELENVSAKQMAEMAGELLDARREIAALTAELEYNEEGYKKMRRKIDLLVKDAIDNHKQVMKEVE